MLFSTSTKWLQTNGSSLRASVIISWSFTPQTKAKRVSTERVRYRKYQNDCYIAPQSRRTSVFAKIDLFIAAPFAINPI